jgi:TrkA domain protein
MDLKRTALVGIGASYAFTTAAGQRAAVIVHVDGRREIVLFDPDDHERVLHTMVLDGAESRTVADLLGLPLVMDRVMELPRGLDGVEAVRIPIPAGSPYAGRRLGDTRARTRTGASIIAVVRDGKVISSPDPEFAFQHGDSVVVVGDGPAVAAVGDLLSNG